MDRYLEETSEFLKLKDLHEIGIVCMFISSKYQEVDPLTLDLMIAKVAHGKLSSKQLLDRERKIASCLRFRFQVPNVFHFLEAYLEIYSPKFLSDDSVLLEENMIKIAKKCILEKRKAFNTLPSILALYVLHKALRSVYELDKKNVLIKEFMNLIKNELSSDEDLRSNCTKGDKNFA